MVETSHWPRGVRGVSLDEIDKLGVDPGGRLYWDGKRIAITGRLTFWQAVGGFIVGTFIVVGSIATAVQAWVAYLEWASG